MLGELAHNVYGPDDGIGVEVWQFEPQAVWWGSANWTQLSPSHLEVGFARDDPALVREAADFVADVIAVSEPVDITCVGPEPNLVPAEFDDAAMAEAAYENTSPISKGWTREEGRPVHYPRPRDRARRGVCWTKRGSEYGVDRPG